MSRSRHALLIVSAACLAGCASGSVIQEGRDSGAAAIDATPRPFPDASANTPDAQTGGTPDARPAPPDAQPFADAPENRPDADPPDAAPPDADIGPDADPNEVVFASANVDTPNTNGFNVSTNVWLGWRFEVTAPLTTHTVGFYTMGGANTIFAAIVRLDDGTDVPDSIDLSSGDVVATPEVTTVPAGSGDLRVALEVPLQPGWYAVIFGTGAFGAANPTLTLAARGNTPIAGAMPPFTMVQSTGTISETNKTDMRFFVKAIMD